MDNTDKIHRLGDISRSVDNTSEIHRLVDIPWLRDISRSVDNNGNICRSVDRQYANFDIVYFSGLMTGWYPLMNNSWLQSSSWCFSGHFDTKYSGNFPHFRLVLMYGCVVACTLGMYLLEEFFYYKEKTACPFLKQDIRWKSIISLWYPWNKKKGSISLYFTMPYSIVTPTLHALQTHVSSTKFA